MIHETNPQATSYHLSQCAMGWEGVDSDFSLKKLIHGTRLIITFIVSTKIIFRQKTGLN